jgi:hypothetical protein
MTKFLEKTAGRIIRLARGFVDRADQCMGMRLTDEVGMRLGVEIDIRDVALATSQAAGILLAPDGLSDAKAHVASRRKGVL